MTYYPEPPPISENQEVKTALEYIHRQLSNISAALGQVQNHDVIHAAPNKVIEGMQVYADGTDWNPGGGAGLYEYTGGGTNGWRMLASGVQY